MQTPHKTRWYQSLTLRVLALFWFLLLGAAAAAFYTAYHYTQPTQPEPLAEDFERTLQPVFESALGAGLLQPGRLLVGEYRVLARYEHTALEPTFAPALHPDYRGYISDLLDQPEALQVPVGDKMLAGPFTVDNALLVVARPLTEQEISELIAQHERDWFPRVVWLSVAFSGVGALILGVWFVRPLRRLRNATREIAEGKAYPNLARLPNRRDELGELARTLAATAVELATSRDAQRRLLSDVSHELRSPLARSQIALDLLGDETETLRTSPHYRQIEKDIFRLGTIIDSILWLSRLENGLDEPIREEVKPMELFEEMKGDIGYAQADWQERLRLEGSDLPTLQTDPVLLRLVLENLIRNGFQYGPEQGIVTLTAKQVQSAGKACLKMDIRDQGPGVEPSKLEQLFEPFFRADPSRHHGAGVGLGLALCQRATRVLGGELEAQNHPEGGLIASLTVPLA